MIKNLLDIKLWFTGLVLFAIAGAVFYLTDGKSPLPSMNVGNLHWEQAWAIFKGLIVMGVFFTLLFVLFQGGSDGSGSACIATLGFILFIAVILPLGLWGTISTLLFGH